MLLLLAGCGGEDNPTRLNDFTLLTSIEISSPTTLTTIAPLTSIPLQAIGNFSGLFTKDIADRVTWESRSTTVADFPFPGVPGRVKGLAPGMATLRASSGDVEAFFDLEVTAATISSLNIDPAAPSVPKGLTTPLAANGTFSVGLPQDLTFDAAWTSSDTAVATVSDAFASKVLAEGITKGTTTISATFDTFPPATATLTVTDPLLQSITITPASPSVLSIAQTPFTATGNYSDASTQDITNHSNIIWSTSQPSVASITTGGMATTLKQGTTSIGAALGTVSTTTSLSVTGGNLTAIILTPSSPKLAVGTSRRLTATGTFSNGTTRDITGRLTWSVDASSAATITLDGNLAWLHSDAAASTTIRAGWGTVKGETPLTVENLTLSSLSITPATLDLTVGTSARFTATGTYSNKTSQDLTSSAEWSSPVAAVEVLNLGVNKGRVKGAIVATNPAATITADFGGQPDTATVGNVVQRTLQTLAISAQPVTFIPGTQAQFTATTTYSDGTANIDVTEDAAWSIDKTNVAIFTDAANDPGQVVAVDSGTATLTAKFGGMTQTQTLTVP
jgi:hypothetical protein